MWVERLLVKLSLNFQGNSCQVRIQDIEGVNLSRGIGVNWQQFKLQSLIRNTENAGANEISKQFCYLSCRNKIRF